jgi:hypothetical protein
MSLSRKHFEAVAEILLRERDKTLEGERAWYAVDRIAYELAKYFRTQNENFDIQRFLAATGG